MSFLCRNVGVPSTFVPSTSVGIRQEWFAIPSQITQPKLIWKPAFAVLKSYETREREYQEQWGQSTLQQPACAHSGLITEPVSLSFLSALNKEINT